MGESPDVSQGSREGTKGGRTEEEDGEEASVGRERDRKATTEEASWTRETCVLATRGYPLHLEQGREWITATLSSLCR